MARTQDFRKVFGFITGFMMLVALYAIFIYAPEEKTMGVIQRIFYLHVSSAFLAFFAFFITFIASILFLVKKERKWDTVAFCSVEIGVLFCTIVLVTGPIWAKPVWNVWWTWDPRLMTTLILWFIYIAYLMLRGVAGENQRSNVCAVLGIMGFVNVPLTFFAIRFWRTIHPVVFTPQGLNISAPMRLTLLLSFTAFCLFFFFLLVTRIGIETLKVNLEEVNALMEDNFHHRSTN